MMPKPLDLKKIRKWVNEDLLVKNEGVERAVDLILNKVNEQVRSACKFYLKYKDNPKLLLGKIELSDEDKIVVENVIKALDELDNAFWATPTRYGFVHYMVLRSYNEWLFKLAFKDVLVEEVG